MGEAADDGSGVAALDDEVFKAESKALWVFAYGSLCWKPGFQFSKAVTGHVQGYSRRFWQGNTTHRGTAAKPGRVATLVENKKDLVHGVAFAISGEDAIPYLSNRECQLGGYVSLFTDFYPLNGDAFKVLLYVATPRNPHWLGEAPALEIARQVVGCSGASGHNVEYVLRLAAFMKQHFPRHQDPHLFDIEAEVVRTIDEHKLCVDKLMGSGEGCIRFVKQERRASTDSNDDNNPERVETFQHTTRIPEKTLRCLNI